MISPISIIACMLVLLNVCCSRGALAQENPRECAGIRDDPLRLECYDLLFRKRATASAINKWIVKKDISKLDDSTNVVIAAKSVDPHVDRFGRSEFSWLYITCRENNTDLYIFFAGQFMSDIQGGGRVTYRIDDQDAKNMNFVESNDHSGLGLWSGSVAIPFIRALLDADILLVRATPHSESAVTATFPITGLEDAIKPLRDACHW